MKNKSITTITALFVAYISCSLVYSQSESSLFQEDLYVPVKDLIEKDPNNVTDISRKYLEDNQNSGCEVLKAAFDVGNLSDNQVGDFIQKMALAAPSRIPEIQSCAKEIMPDKAGIIEGAIASLTAGPLFSPTDNNRTSGDQGSDNDQFSPVFGTVETNVISATPFIEGFTPAISANITSPVSNNDSGNSNPVNPNPVTPVAPVAPVDGI